MNVIDKIYELIQKDNSINTFNNNQYLFINFYYNEIDLIYNDPKVMYIFKYILSLNIDDENEIFPYINSKIFNAFNMYEQKITQSVFMKGNFNDEYVELIYKLIDDYNFMRNYKDNAKLYQLYDDNTFIRDYTNAMIILLNTAFFDISNDNIKKMMNFIKNNKYLQSIIESGKEGNKILDKEYLYDYSSRFLFNSFFFNEKDVANDQLLLALKEGKIKDKDTFSKILKNTDIAFITLVFDYNLSSIIDVIENTFNDDVIIINLSSIVINKLFDNGYYDLLIDFIMYDSRSDKYIDKDVKKVVTYQYPFSTGKDLTDEEVNYYLDNCPGDIIFLTNLKDELNYASWDEATRRRVIEATKDIPYYELDTSQALLVLNVLFTKETGINYQLLVAALKRLIKDYTNDESVRVFVAYKDNNNGGTTFSEENTITLNAMHILNLLKGKKIDSNPEILNILNTVFHEARHIVQFSSKDELDVDDELYIQYKEDVLGALLVGYYKKNYFSVSYERDARICGAQGVVQLLSSYFQYMKESIKYYNQIEYNEKIIPVEKEKIIFELSNKITVDEALEKIISINPRILQRFVALRREYDFNGKKKEDNSKVM